MSRPAGPPRILFLAAVLGALATLGAGLHMDDYTAVRHGRAADWSLRVLGTSYFHGGKATSDGYLPVGYEKPVANYFRPLLVAMFKLEWGVFGSWAPGYHLTNVVLHLLNVWLLWGLVLRLGLSRPVAGWAAVLFLFHAPSQAAVAWVSGRSEVVVATLTLAALHAYIRFRQGGRAGWLVLLVAAVTLAMGAKEGAVLLPLLLAAWDRFGSEERRFTPWPLLALVPVAGVLAYRLSLPGVGRLPPPSFYFHPPSEPGFLLHVLGRALESVLGIVPIMNFTIIPFAVLVTPPVIGGLAAAAAVVILAVRPAVERGRQTPFLLVWALLALGPTLLCTQLPLYLYGPALAASVLLAQAVEPSSWGDEAAPLVRWLRPAVVVWVVVGMAAMVTTPLWLDWKSREQEALAAAVFRDRAALIEAGGPVGRLRVHVIGASLPFSGARAMLSLRLPGEAPEFHVLTLSSYLLGPRQVAARWVVPPRDGEVGATLRIEEGARHPYRNERFGPLHPEPVAFDAGDEVATASYVIRLEKEQGGYVWTVRFTEAWRREWLVYVLGPGGVSRPLGESRSGL